MIWEKQLVDRFCRLAAISSPSLSEKAMADAVRFELGQLGLILEEDETGRLLGSQTGNLLCRIPGDLPGPPLLFGTHLDTVEPCRNKQIRVGTDRIIRSDGTTILGADDLSGVAAVIEAIALLRHQGIKHRSLELLFTVAEEKHLLGSHQLAAGWLTAVEGYVLDTSGEPGLGVIRSPGHMLLEFDIEGQAAHAGIAPETGISAITVAAAAIAAMKLGRLDDQTTANIGSIQGGGETNIVAANCRVTAECRSLDALALRQQADHMIRCFENSARQAGAGIRIEEKTSYLPYQVDPAGPVVRRFSQACDYLGLPLRLMATGGGSDMNVLTQLGLSGMVLSCGMERVHSCEEFLRIDDLVSLTRLVMLLMSDLNQAVLEEGRPDKAEDA